MKKLLGIVVLGLLICGSNFTDAKSSELINTIMKKNHKVMENELIKHCENLIGKFKSPNKIHFLSELPKGPSGKIQRFKIQDKIK